MTVSAEKIETATSPRGRPSVRLHRESFEAPLRLSGIVEQSIVDGPGLRMTVFTQGCPHRCAGCHNPSTHSAGLGYSESVDAILARFDDDPLLSGITLSGGEPLSQAAALAPLAAGVKRRGKSVWCYTGYTFEAVAMARSNRAVAALLRAVDVLVDGRYEAALHSLSLPFRGSSNQRLVDVPQSLESGRVMIWAE